MLDLAVLNSLILLGDVLQEPTIAYTDCSLLNKVEGIDLPVRLYSKGERIATVGGSKRENAVGAFLKGTGVFIDEKMAELPTIASLHFGRLTIEVLGVAGSLAILYQEFRGKVPSVLRQYVQMCDPLDVYRLYEAITTDERDSYDDYIRACFGWSSYGTYAGDLIVPGVYDGINDLGQESAEDTPNSESPKSEEDLAPEGKESEAFDWDDNEGIEGSGADLLF